MKVRVIGAGVAGLTCAVELAERGVAVEVIDRAERLGEAACSWLAGGMLAPWCELESAEEEVAIRGAEAIDWWREHVPGVVRNGSLVVAPPRDQAELSRFARRTRDFEWVDGDGIAALEPDLAGRFNKGLYFPGEAHLDPRAALAALVDRLASLGVAVRFGIDADETAPADGPIVDCRGFAATDKLSDLRGVKGEMLLIRTEEISLQRPVRMLHPRIPLYVVPRQDDLFMVGATMIESADRSRITARSMMELLGGAFALHPAFGEAEVVETGCDVRPAFTDNLPEVRHQGRTIFVNGLYRHGFLLAPTMASKVADMISGEAAIRVGDGAIREVGNEAHC